MIDSNLKERCVKCVLPRTATSASFNPDGICTVCESAQSDANPTSVAPENSSEALNDSISRIRHDGKKKPFDCIVGISGGRDSTYLLHELSTKHHLRCLAAYYRTPFANDIVHQNVLRLTDKLDTPLETIKISPESHRKFARKMIILWSKRKQWIYANLACAQCKLFNSEIFHIAKKHKTKWIIYGSNSIESFQGASWRKSSAGQSQGADDKHFSFFSQMAMIMSIAKKGTELLVLSPELWRHLWLIFRASILSLTPDMPYLKIRYPNIHVLHYFYYAGWEEGKCENALKAVGWELPFGAGTTWRADCSYAALKDYILFETMGTTYLDSLLSNMIRSGMVTREEALRRLEEECDIFPQKVQAALNVLDLPATISLPNLPEGCQSTKTIFHEHDLPNKNSTHPSESNRDSQMTQKISEL